MIKSITKMLSLVSLTLVLVFTACKKKDTVVALPSENVTSYTGDLGFTGGSCLPIANTSGKATITESDKIVSISFSDNVPTL
jgi:hypothetical protein